MLIDLTDLAPSYPTLAPAAPAPLPPHPLAQTTQHHVARFPRTSREPRDDQSSYEFAPRAVHATPCVVSDPYGLSTDEPSPLLCYMRSQTCTRAKSTVLAQEGKEGTFAECSSLPCKVQLYIVYIVIDGVTSSCAHGLALIMAPTATASLRPSTARAPPTARIPPAAVVPERRTVRVPLPVEL